MCYPMVAWLTLPCLINLAKRPVLWERKSLGKARNLLRQQDEDHHGFSKVWQERTIQKSYGRVGALACAFEIPPIGHLCDLGLQ